jgi:hypothetical protein
MRAEGKEIVAPEGEKLATKPTTADCPSYRVKDDELLWARTRVQGIMGILARRAAQG